MEFYPEGYRLGTDQNRLRTASLSALAEAAKSQDILEGKAMVCDAAHNRNVDLGGGLRGIIPREEGALGVREGKTRDIAMISRVNKPVCFTVTGFETRDGEVLPGYVDADNHHIDAVRYATNRIWKRRGS